ncbi:MAG: NAD-dependent epimerase/dehydratase family protein [Paracoccaceae bacterium]
MTGRVLITGAGGFVGSSLSAGFATLGWQVTAVDLGFDPATVARLKGCDLVTLDLDDGTVPDLPRADVVIHAAALTTEPEALGITQAEHLARNMRPLLCVLQMAAAHTPGAFVFLSSSGVFNGIEGCPDLTDACQPTGLAPYSAAKRASELLVVSALAALCPVHVLRLGYIYGPDEVARASRMRVSVVAGMIAAARAGQALPLRSDDPRRDWTFAADLAPAIAALVIHAAAGHPLHFGSGHILPDSAVAALVARHFGTLRLFRIPASGAKPPMVASVLPALEGFRWTPPEEGIAMLCRQQVAA